MKITHYGSGIDAMWVTPGEVNPVAFVAEIEAQNGGHFDWTWVKTGWVRNVPIRDDPDGYTHRLETDVKPGRGAYLATWVS